AQQPPAPGQQQQQAQAQQPPAPGQQQQQAQAQQPPAPGQQQQQAQAQQPPAPQQPGPPIGTQEPPVSGNLQFYLDSIELLQGENIIASLEGDGFFLGTNPLLKLFAKFTSFMVTLTGGHIRIMLVLTNKRIFIVQKSQAWCGCTASKNIRLVALKALVEAGAAKDTQVCCFHSNLVTLETRTENFAMILKNNDDQLLKQFINQMALQIQQNNNSL
nr:hypothetical protein [Deltaproteobacteria bacterium]